MDSMIYLISVAPMIRKDAGWENFQKNWKKVLTKRIECDILINCRATHGSADGKTDKWKFVPCKLNNVEDKQRRCSVLGGPRTERTWITRLLWNFAWSKAQLKKISIKWYKFFREFDPGSGWTLAACLTHASRTELLWQIPSGWRWFNLVADGWVTREQPASKRGTTAGNGC